MSVCINVKPKASASEYKQYIKHARVEKMNGNKVSLFADILLWYVLHMWISFGYSFPYMRVILCVCAFPECVSSVEPYMVCSVRFSEHSPFTNGQPSMSFHRYASMHPLLFHEHVRCASTFQYSTEMSEWMFENELASHYIVEKSSKVNQFRNSIE